MSLNVRSYNNKEALLFPARIGDYLPKDHLACIVDEVVDELNLSCFYNKVSPVGNKSYHPRMMLKVLFYAYTQKTVSSRKISGKLDTDVAFIFLSGMQRPDFRTISDFRKNNLKEISELFVQIVRLAKELGMVELGHISLDSTVIKANASKDRFCTKDKLDKEKKIIKQKIDEFLQNAQDTDDDEDQRFGPDKRGDEIPEELRNHKERLEKIKAAKKALEQKPQKEVNLTDEDATLQKSQHKFVSGYRPQISVDEKEQVIVACDVTDSATDAGQLEPQVEQTLKNTQRDNDKTTIITADSAYSSMGNLNKLERQPNIDAYIPDAKYQAKERNKRTDEDSPFHKNNFRHQSNKDTYLCPNNQELHFIGRGTNDKGNRFSAYRCNSSQRCKYFGVCTKSPKGRTIKICDDIHLIHNMRKKLDTQEGKLIYKKRQAIVEPVFGNIKHNLGFREFLLRGLNKVKTEFRLIATAHNLLKIAKFIKKQRLSTVKDRYLIPVPAG